MKLHPSAMLNNIYGKMKTASDKVKFTISDIQQKIIRHKEAGKYNIE